jgi:protein-tyrosine phosphatase
MQDIFWIKSRAGGTPEETSPHLAIVLRPRGDDWLGDELIRMKQGGIDTVVSLLEPDEAEVLGLAKGAPLAAQVGMKFLSFPIPDTHVPPDIAAFREFVSALADRARAGERIGFHCRGSIGRATVTAACTLVQLGWQAKSALAAIEVARGCPVPDTDEQSAWILRYEARR